MANLKLLRRPDTKLVIPALQSNLGSGQPPYQDCPVVKDADPSCQGPRFESSCAQIHIIQCPSRSLQPGKFGFHTQKPQFSGMVFVRKRSVMAPFEVLIPSFRSIFEGGAMSHPIWGSISYLGLDSRKNTPQKKGANFLKGSA